MRRVALAGIHELITGPPDAGDCVRLLTTYFGADPDLDPGAGEPLAARVGALGPSIEQLDVDNMWHQPLHFTIGTDHQIDGRTVRLFLGAPGAPVRYAYVLDEPETYTTYVNARAEWSWHVAPNQPQSVTDLVASTLIDELRLGAPSCAQVYPPNPTERDADSSQGPWGPDPVPRAEVDRLVRDHCTVPLTPVRPLTSVGPDLMVHVFAGSAYLSGPSDQALRACGLLEIDGWRVDVHRSSEPAPPAPEPAKLRPGQFVSAAEIGPNPALADLEQVPWDLLTHAYGPATDVPDQIRDFLGGDDQAHEEALDRLYGNIFHQGTRYPATPWAVPFLALGLDGARPAVTLRLLLDLAVGYEQDCFPDTFDMAARRDARSNDAAAHHDLLVAEIETNEAVCRQWDRIAVAAASHGRDTQAAEQAMQLLAYLPDRADDSFELLTGLVAAPEPRPSAWIALGMLGRHLGRSAPDVADRVPADPGSALECAQLVGRCLLGDTATADGLVQHLGLVHHDLAQWLENDQTTLITASLATLSDWPDDHDLRVVLAEAKRIDPFRAANVLAVLFASLLPEGLPRDASNLTAMQRRALEGGLEIAAGPTNQPRLVNLDHSLPLRPPALRRYLDGSHDPTL